MSISILSKSNFFKALSLLVVFSLLTGGVTAFAQGVGWRPLPERSWAGYRPDTSMPAWSEPIKGRSGASPVLDLSPASADIALGQIGLTHSHAQTYGVAETAHFIDNQHLAYPYGVGVDGNNVWVADSEGNRAVKFDSSGDPVMTIGLQGFREYYEDLDVSLNYIFDVGVDSSGNIYLVDGAQHVVKFDSSGTYQSQLGTQWESGSDNDHFNQPRGIAFDASSNIYVSDCNNHRVQIFDSSGTWIATLGTGVAGNANNQFDRPQHIAIYGNYLFVADSRNHRVQVLDITNPLAPGYVATLGSLDDPGDGNNQFNLPTGVAVNASYIFVADYYNSRVQVFNRVGYAYLATIGGDWGSGDYQFTNPADVAVDASGNLYVADESNMRVQKFGPSRIYVDTLGTTGVPYLTDNLHYKGPTGVAVAADGSIYVLEERGRRLLKLNASGTPVWAIGEPGVWGEDNNHFGDPQDVDVDASGRVIVADTWNHRLQFYNSSGVHTDTFGSYGAGNYQFDGAQAVALDRNGNLYVVDVGNQRVQVYNSSLSYLATIGQLGFPGPGNNQFEEPVDIAVDSSGQIYVVDLGNHRVQVFGANRAYLRTIGETGVAGRDYDHLQNPVAIAIDPHDRVYIADSWGNYIKVYDKTGAFLTIIQNGWGSEQGMMRQAEALALDSASNLYVADYLTHVVKRYLPRAYPRWTQANINGFGTSYNWGAWSMTVYSDTLLVSTSNGLGAQLYSYSPGSWTQVMSGGFGDDRNQGIDSFAEFEGNLYAGTWTYQDAAPWTYGGQIWRSPTAAPGSWERVVDAGFGEVLNGEVMSLAPFGDHLYAGTWSYNSATHGAEIWRSDSGDEGTWTRVLDATAIGHGGTESIMTMEVFGNTLYAGTRYLDGPGELWRTTNGVDWELAAVPGFGDPLNHNIVALEVFNGQLYVGVMNRDYTLGTSDGAQIWRSANGNTWEQVVDAGFGLTNNIGVSSLFVFADQLYAITRNNVEGVEVWRSPSGDAGSWEPIARHSFGAEWQSAAYAWDTSHAVWGGQLYIGTYGTWLAGGRVWTLQDEALYLPLVFR